MFAQLGSHIFKGLKTPLSWDAADAARIGKIPHINGKDAIQKNGDELGEINLTIQYSAGFCEPDQEIYNLKKSMRDGEILPFITGEGYVIGKYIITAVDVTNEILTPSARVEGATVTINLLEYSNTNEEPPQRGTAVKSENPPVEPPASITTISSANDITNNIAKAKSKVSQMKSTISNVKKGLTSFKKGVRDVRKLATDVQQAYTTAKTKVENTKKIIQRASELPSSLDGAIKYAENLAKLDNVADVTVLEMNVLEMSASADKVTTHAAPVAAFSATKEGGN